MKKKVLTLTISKQWFDMVVAGYIEDKYIVLGFNDYKGGGILEFTRKGQKVLCEVYKSYRLH